MRLFLLLGWLIGLELGVEHGEYDPDNTLARGHKDIAVGATSGGQGVKDVTPRRLDLIARYTQAQLFDIGKIVSGDAPTGVILPSLDRGFSGIPRKLRCNAGILATAERWEYQADLYCAKNP